MTHMIAEARLKNNSFVLNLGDIFNVEGDRCEKESHFAGVEIQEEQCKVAVSDANFDVKVSNLVGCCNENKEELQKVKSIENFSNDKAGRVFATSRVIRFKEILAKQALISHTFGNKSFISVAGSCVKHGKTKKADVKFI